VALFGLCAAAFLATLALVALGLAARAGPVILGLGSVVPALLFVALVPAIMRASRKGIAATQFALFMATLNLGDVAGAAASGAVASVLGLGATALATALVFAGWGAAIMAVPALLFRPEPPGGRSSG
jgi:PAT family beta-lactamase induction signal transducer AmpG